MYSYLAIPLTVIFGSFAAAAAAPSFQHGRISVDVTHTNVQDQADKYNLPCSSGKKAVIISEDEPRLSSLPFNFTLFARNLQGTETLPGGLPVGFADLTLADGHARLELGYETEFALRDGKLINGNRGIEYHVAKVLPPWLSLWSFDKRHTYLQFAAYPNPLEEGGDQYLLKLTATPVIFGVKRFAQGAPVFIGPSYSHGDQLSLEIKAISNNGINADSTEDLL